MTSAALSAHRGGRVAFTRLRAVLDTLILWRQRARQRRHLLSLEERLYRDIGVTASDAYREAQKPFWRA